MNVEIQDVGDLPAHTFISVRYGELRKQAPFRKGEIISFPSLAEPAKLPKAYTVDVLRKLGSKQVSLAGITALGSVTHEKLTLPSLDIHGAPVTVSLAASLASAPNGENAVKAGPRQREQAARVTEYLSKHKVQALLHELFTQLLETLPIDPLIWMSEFLDQKLEEAEASQEGPRDFKLMPGLGDLPLPGFASPGPPPEALPNLAIHHSLAADVLRKDPGLYSRLRSTRTSLGVSFAECIKPAIDCPGHELVKVAGAYAGDGESYEMFKELFDPMIGALHCGSMAGPHPLEGNPNKITNTAIDPSGNYAVSSTLEMRRNLQGLRFATCCSKEERREVERVAVQALSSLVGDLKGIYYPLRGSESFSVQATAENEWRPSGGMAFHQEQQLRQAGALFTEPDSRQRLAAGFGRHWPDARGVFVGEAPDFYVWCNEEDHLRFFAKTSDVVDLKRLWTRMNKASLHVEAIAQSEKSGFSRSPRLGYLTACPSKLGAAMRASVSLKVPRLAAATDLPAFCRSLQLLVSSDNKGSSSPSRRGTSWTVSNAECYGLSEVDLLSSVIEGCAQLVQAEMMLEKGLPIYPILPGLGEAPFPGYSSERCPTRLPDLSNHHNFAAIVLRENPEIYKLLRTRRTTAGVGLALCIKPGLDDRGLAAAPTSGLVAGCEECCTVFRELFDPVLERLHGPHAAACKVHPLDCDPRKISDASIDIHGQHAVSVRVELRRNLHGIRLPPSCTSEERREVERLVMKGLLRLRSNGIVDGEYYPLCGSRSYVPRPGGSSPEEEAQFRQAGLLQHMPASSAQLAAGLGRCWPEARGSFITDNQDLSIGFNEEDHIRVAVARRGGDIKAALCEVLAVVASLEIELKKDGHGYARDLRFGFLTVLPELLGTALQCAVSLNLPLLGARPDFPELVAALGLRGARQGVTWELASGSSFGISEVDLVQGLLVGCAKLVSIEEHLAQGDFRAEEELRQILPPGTPTPASP